MRRFDIDSDARLAEARDFIDGLSEAGGGDPAIAGKIEATRGIVEAVRARGDAALAEFTERFDGVALRPDQFEVTPAEIDAAVASVDPALVAILERAHENIRDFHSRGLRASWEHTLPDGTVLGQRITPVESAGVYVPGGQAFYPSSVLMNIVPARVAGVPEIVMVSPPSYQGGIHPAVLAAARIAGATRVFRIGGAQAVAALAYGTETIPAVTKITGPGNTFVTAAKALVRHVAEIDSEAGPSEVLVIADADANPAYVAAEMLAQAEHDEDAKSWLATPSAALADAVAAEVARKAAELPRRAIIEASIARHAAIFVTRDLDEAVGLANRIAAEHLSIQTAEPRAVADRIRNAGAIMIGAHTPVAVGDYYAGPNHILPTGRQARFSSPLTAEAFRKVSSIIHYTPERLRASADDITRFAHTEELQAHAWSIEVRE
jgi:histidinol dehydrogenase